MKQAVLRAYQDIAVDFGMRTPFCAYLLEPGLGKSLCALETIGRSLFDYIDTRRWLIAGPKLVVSDSFVRQFRMWANYRHLTWRLLTAEDFNLRADYEQVTETRRQRTGLTFGSRIDKAAVKADLRDMREDVHLVGTHLLPWLVKAYGANWPYDGVVIDESLSMANSESAQHKAVWHVAHRLGAVTRLVEMNGTPAPNSIEQLHGQIRLLDGGTRLGKTKTEFLDNFMVPDKLDRKSGRVWSWKPARGAREDVQERIKDVCVALRADDWLDLPELLVNPIYVPLPDEARTAYDTLEAELIVMIEGEKVLSPSQGVLASKLRQIANGAVYFDKDKFKVLSDFKLDRVESLMNETSTPVVLAYQFRSDWERIEKRFGKTATHITAVGALDKFRNSEVRLLCGHAGGFEGVDGLQDVSHTIIWFGATFNGRHWTQSNLRLRRDGSKASRVIAHQILAADTVEGHYAGVVLPERIEEQDALLNALAWRAHQR